MNPFIPPDSPLTPVQCAHAPNEADGCVQNPAGCKWEPSGSLIDPPTASEPTPIATGDWSQPAFTGTGGSDAATRSRYWDCQETSGSSLAEGVNGNPGDALEVTGVAGATIVGQTFAGLSDGNGLSSIKAAELLLIGNNGFDTSNTGLFELTDSLCVRGVVRIPRATTTRYLMTDHDGSNGWRLYVKSNGQMFFDVDDGTTSTTVNVAGQHCAGAAHPFQLSYNATTQQIKLLTDIGESSADVSALSFSAIASVFRVLKRHNSSAGLHTQITHISGWNGAAAETAAARALSDWWRQFGSPSGLPSWLQDELEAYIGVHPVPCNKAHGSADGLYYLASGEAAHWPIGWSQKAVDRGLPNGYLFWSGNDTNNDLDHSEELEDTNEFTAVNCTVSTALADLADNKFGYRMARKLTATANGGYVRTVFASSSTAALRSYYWVKGDGKDVTGRIVAHDGTSEVAAATFTALDGVWTPVQLAWTGSGSDHVRVEIDNNTDALWLCHWAYRVSQDASDNVPIMTFGSTATTDDVNILQAIIADADWPEVRGSLEVFLIANSDGDNTANMSFMDFFKVGSGLNDRFILEITSVGADSNAQIRSWDESGSAVANAALKTGDSKLENGDRYRIEWDSEVAIEPNLWARSQWSDEDGTGVVDLETVSGWSAGGAGINRLSIGAQGAGGTTPGVGGIGYFRLYDQVGVFDFG